MEKTVISTTDAPAAIGPYSQAIKAGNLVFVSGQLPINSHTGVLVSDDIKKATKQSMDNVEAILKKAGTSMGNIVKTTVFLSDMKNFVPFNEVYGTYFKDKMPARSAIQIVKLPKDAIVEVEAIALIPEP